MICELCGKPLVEEPLISGVDYCRCVDEEE